MGNKNLSIIFIPSELLFMSESYSINQNDSQIKKYFAKLAEHYLQFSHIQQEVSRRLLNRLDYFRLNPSIILDLGCGHAKNLSILQSLYKDSTVIGLDLSVEMLRKYDDTDTSNYICADAKYLPINKQSVDLIFINLLFPWINDLQQLFIECQRILRPGGLMLFATLGPDTFHELRYSWYQTGMKTYCHPFIDMHLLGDELIKGEFTDPVMDKEYITFAYPDLSVLLKETKAQGFKNLHPQRAPGLASRKKYQIFADTYQETYTSNDGIFPVTYEVIYGQAWAPATIKAKAQTVNIPISLLRHKLNNQH